MMLQSLAAWAALMEHLSPAQQQRARTRASGAYRRLEAEYGGAFAQQAVMSALAELSLPLPREADSLAPLAAAAELILAT